VQCYANVRGRGERRTTQTAGRNIVLSDETPHISPDRRVVGSRPHMAETDPAVTVRLFGVHNGGVDHPHGAVNRRRRRRVSGEGHLSVRMRERRGEERRWRVSESLAIGMLINRRTDCLQRCKVYSSD
jgi:hypothetical protein